MEYFVTDNTNGVKSHKNKNIVQIEISKDKTIIYITINETNMIIDRDFIRNNITPNFSVELFYYVLCEFIKYDNYKLINNNNQFIFDGIYCEPYEQGDIIHVHFVIY